MQSRDAREARDEWRDAERDLLGVLECVRLRSRFREDEDEERHPERRDDPSVVVSDVVREQGGKRRACELHDEQEEQDDVQEPRRIFEQLRETLRALPALVDHLQDLDPAHAHQRRLAHREEGRDDDQTKDAENKPEIASGHSAAPAAARISACSANIAPSSSGVA